MINIALALLIGVPASSLQFYPGVEFGSLFYAPKEPFALNNGLFENVHRFDEHIRSHVPNAFISDPEATISDDLGMDYLLSPSGYVEPIIGHARSRLIKERETLGGVKADFHSAPNVMRGRLSCISNSAIQYSFALRGKAYLGRNASQVGSDLRLADTPRFGDGISSDLNRVLPLLQSAKYGPKTQRTKNKLKNGYDGDPEGPERGTLLGYEVALIMLSSLACFWVSYSSFNKAWNPATGAAKLSYFVAAWLAGCLGLIGVLLALAA